MDTPALTPPPPPPPSPVAADYERDFHAWCLAQAAALRARARPGANDGLDYANLAEEIESLGISDRRAIAAHLRGLLLHLIKWQHHPERRGSSWEISIDNARDAIADLIQQSPSLASLSAAVLDTEYQRAARDAAKQMGVPGRALPADCPFTIGQILAPEFLPDASQAP